MKNKIRLGQQLAKLLYVSLGKTIPDDLKTDVKTFLNNDLDTDGTQMEIIFQITRLELLIDAVEKLSYNK